MNAAEVDELGPELTWIVDVNGVPIAPEHPLNMVEAAELWQVYARRRGVIAEIRVWPRPPA